MNSIDSILEAALAQASVPVEALASDVGLALSQAEIDRVLECAYSLGIRDGRHSVFSQSDDMATQLFRQLMESLPDLVYFKDLHSRFICINRALADYFGLDDPLDAIGKSDFDFFEPHSAQAKFEDEQAIIRTGEGWSFHEEQDLRDGAEEKWVISSKLPLFDPAGNICGTFGLSRDITQQKLAETEVLRQRRLLDTIIQILPCRLFLRDRDGKFILANQEYRKVIGAAPDLNISGKRLTDLADEPRSDRVLEEDLRIIESGEPVLNKLEFDESVHTGGRWVLTSKVPLRSEGGEIEGIVGMSLDITEQKRAETLARKAKEALQAKNEEYEDELLVARQLQEQLMSMGFNKNHLYSCSHDNWSFQATYLYEPSHHLAGDFFYLLPVTESKVAVLVCDVMGHGVKAALVTMLIRGLMAEIPDILSHPSQVLQHLNETILALAKDEEFPRFVTAAYLIVDLQAGEATIASAGHPCPILNDGARGFRECPCDSDGPALGLIEGETFGDTTFRFDGESELFLFTDGILQQHGAHSGPFGVDGVIGALKRSPTRELSQQLATIKDALEAALDGSPPSDDICVVGLKINPASATQSA